MNIQLKNSIINLLKQHYGASKALFIDNHLHIDNVDIDYVILAINLLTRNKYDLIVDKNDSNNCVIEFRKK